MKIISHRGNLTGSNPEAEPHPAYIQEALAKGVHVEVDVGLESGVWKLGHA